MPAGRTQTGTGRPMVPETQVGKKLRDLKRRLKQENPVLEHVVDSFRELDRISRRRSEERRVGKEC